MIGLEGPERIGDSMKPLKNALHERFAQLVVSGKSKSEAYREVYPKSREWADKDVHTEASRLYPKVSPRVQALQAEIAKLICIDIQPYGHTQAQERPDIVNVGGFSDQVFSLIAEVAAGGTQQDHWVRAIAAMQL